MTVNTPSPASNEYTNTKCDVTVHDKVGNLEGTARKLAQLVDDDVEWVTIKEGMSTSRHIQVSMHPDTEVPSGLVDQLESWGYERREDSPHSPDLGYAANFCK